MQQRNRSKFQNLAKEQEQIPKCSRGTGASSKIWQRNRSRNLPQKSGAVTIVDFKNKWICIFHYWWEHWRSLAATDGTSNWEFYFWTRDARGPPFAEWPRRWPKKIVQIFSLLSLRPFEYNIMRRKLGISFSKVESREGEPLFRCT